MITPEQVELLAESLLEAYAKMELDLLENVAKRIVLSSSTSGAANFDWLLEKMEQMGSLRKENLEVIAKLSNKTLGEVERIITTAGYRSTDLAESIYADASAAGLTIYQALPLRASLRVQQILQAAVVSAKNVTNLVNTTAIESANESFLRIINQIYLETTTGLYSYDESVAKAARELADAGITGISYTGKNGKIFRQSPEAAVRQMLRTSSARTAGELQLARAEEWGTELVEVSSHWSARPSHAVWQGQIYRLVGGDAEYPNFYDATDYGTGTGLCGWNCRHFFYPYWAGISERRYYPYDLAENARRYKNAQKENDAKRTARQKEKRATTAKAVKQ